MRLRTMFVMFVLLFFIAGFGSGIFYLVSSGQDSFNDQIEDYLSSIIDVNGERIGDFVYEMENDALFFAESNDVREILGKDLGENKDAVKLGIEGRVSIIAKEVSNYLRLRPNTTLVDLQASKEFQTITVQNIGKGGYSVMIGLNDDIIYFHINPNIVGKELEDVSVDKRVLEITNTARDKGFGSGFYNWTDADGVIREKYMEVAIVGEKTADGVSLMSMATVYVKDYLVAENVSDRVDKKLKDFKEHGDYFHFLLVSPEGLIVYMSNPMKGIGVDVSISGIGIDNIGSEISDLERGEVVFYGPFLGYTGMSKLEVAVASKVYDGNEVLGSIVLIKEINGFGDILKKSDSFGVSNEDYIVDKNGLLITPLRTGNVDVLVQEVKTKNVEGCIEDFTQAKRLNMTVEEYDVFGKAEGLELVLLPFQNLEGEETYGLHLPIGKVEWCLLSEVSVDEVLRKPMEQSFKKQILFRIWVFFFVVVITLFASLFIDKRYIVRKREVGKYPCRHVGIKRLFICRLVGGKCQTYPNGRCGKIARKRNFLINLKMRYYFLFSLVLAFAYFFITSIFFKVWKETILFALPYLGMIIVSLMLFFYALKLEKRTRKFLLFASGCLVLSQLIRIVLSQYWIVVGESNPFVWTITIVLNALGFLFLLIFLRRQNAGL